MSAHPTPAPLIQNCGQCPHLIGADTLGMPIYACGKSPKHPIVPQATRRTKDCTTTRFPRVPEFCPLPDHMALKTPEPKRTSSCEPTEKS